MKVFAVLSLLALASGYTIESYAHGQICDVCIDTLEAIKSATTSDEIERLVTDTATTVCSFAPRLLRSKCQSIAEEFISQNFGILRDFTVIFAPKDMCEFIRACPRSDVSLEGKGVTCTMCTDVVALARYTATDPALKTVIKTYLKTACIATGPLSSLCKGEVDQLVDLAFDQLNELFKQFNDEQFCEKLHMCSRKGLELTSGSLCDVCTATVTEIESVLAMDELKSTLEDVVGIACSLIPVKEMSKQCTELTQNTIDEVFYNLNQLLEKYDPETICSIAHLCSKSFSSGLEDASPGPLCTLCEDTLNLYRHVLTDPTLETMVNTDIKYACSYVPLFHKKCESYVDGFTGTLFAQVRSAMSTYDDHNTCILFDFCANDANATTVCDVCVDGFEEVKEFLTSDNLKKIITDEVDMACIAFGPLKRLCVAEANKIVNTVFAILHKLDGVSGQDLCSKIHLCKKEACFY